MPEPALIFGIESSCDETAAAVVADGFHVRSNVVASQAALHEPYGGVVPEIASRAHLERILPTIEKALAQAGADESAITAVAVGNRPGLIGSLLVGVSAAKALALCWQKPIIGIDHVVAHLHAPALTHDAQSAPLHYPALGLVVSGGHTDLFICNSPVEASRIGRTIDDAIGEAFDKAASILNLGYPGGPVVDQRAAHGDESAHDFPVARLEPDSLDFSFSGLKTALLYTVRGLPVGRGKQARFRRDASQLTQAQINDCCASFQRAAVSAVLLKVNRALDDWPRLCDQRCRSIIVGGGVIANSRLRHELTQLARQRDLPASLPAREFCLDNAAMIAGLAYHHWSAGRVDGLSLAATPAGSF